MAHAHDAKHDAGHGKHDAHEGEKLGTYWLIYAALMVLLVLTVAVAEKDFGGYINIIIAMIIAVVKALLVILFFMHVRAGSKLLWVFVSASFFWFGIFVFFTMSDYLTDTNNRIPGPQAGLEFRENTAPITGEGYSNPLSPMAPGPGMAQQEMKQVQGMMTKMKK